MKLFIPLDLKKLNINWSFNFNNMNLVILYLFLFFRVTFASKQGLQEYWKYNFEGSLSGSGVIDLDYSQSSEVAVCKGGSVEYYTHDGSSYTLEETITTACTSVAISKGPHFDVATAVTQIMIGDSQSNSVSFYRKGESGFELSISFGETEDTVGVEVCMPTGGKYAAAVGQKTLYVYIYNDNKWAKQHTKLLSDSNVQLRVDINHDDILVVGAKNRFVKWYRIRFSDMELFQTQQTQNVNIGRAVAATVSCRGSQIAYTQNGALLVYLQDATTGIWSKTQVIKGDILDVEMSLCMIAIRYTTKVDLYMLEQNSDGSFGDKYILTKSFPAKDEAGFGKKVAFKLSDLAILSDTHLSLFRNTDSTTCRKDEYLNAGVCQPCPEGSFNDQLTTSTSCTPNACAINEHSEDGVCKPCPPGTTNVAGDETNTVTQCDSTLCEVDEYVNSQNQCGTCPAGMSTFGKRYTTVESNIESCKDILCGRDEFVLSNQCQPCASGSTAAPGAKASGSDTVCLTGKCGDNQFVKDNQCWPCPKGSIHATDTPLTSSDTTCSVVTCGANEKVRDNECVSCGDANAERSAGDEETGVDTFCTCKDNFFTNAQGVCEGCPAGTEYQNSIARSGVPTVCSDIKCNENQYVQNNACVNCKANSHFRGRSKASGSTTYCYCDDGFRSTGTNRECAECVGPAYVQEQGDKTDAATTCKCGENHKASGSGTCVACLTGSTRKAGDDPTSSQTFCQCDVGFRSKGDGTCEVCPTGYTTLTKTSSLQESVCVCAENYRVQRTGNLGACVPCFEGATRKPGDNPISQKRNTFCAYDGIVFYINFDSQTSSFTSELSFNSVQTPTFDMRLGQTYSMVRTGTGSPLRVLTATDCPDCANGVVPNPVPASSISLYDSQAPEANVDESVVVITPTQIETLFYVSTDGSAVTVGEINVKFAQCIGVLSEGTYVVGTSCVLKQEITLTGDLTVQASPSAARRFKLRGGNKLILSSDNLHRHFVVQNGHKLTIKNLDVREGYSEEDGGSIVVTNGAVHIEDSILQLNKVASNKKGGVIFGSENALITIKDCTIENNEADQGGFVYLDVATNNNAVGVSVSNTLMKGNSASFQGGAVALAKETSLTCENCNFDNNVAKSGGAVSALEKNNLDIKSSSFTGNKATDKYGGAIQSLSCSSNEISSTTFSSNEAEEGGAGIYNNYQTGTHACNNKISQCTFSDNIVKVAGKKGGAAMHLGSTVHLRSAHLRSGSVKQHHFVTASNFTNNKEDTVENDFAFTEGSSQELKVVDQEPAVGMDSGPTISTSCHIHACMYKPLASSCTAADNGLGIACGCDMGTNTVSASSPQEKTKMKAVIAILFASDVQATDIIRMSDSNNRYVPPKMANNPTDAKALAELNVILSKPENQEGSPVGEKTVLMKPVIPGKTLCTSFQSWLCEKVTACSTSDGNVTVECDGVLYYPQPASRRRLFSPIHAAERRFRLRSGTTCIDRPGFPLQQQCTGVDEDGNAQTYDRCKANAVMNAEGTCVCNVGFKVNAQGDTCEPEDTQCRRNEHVVNSECEACPEGLYNLEGDSISLVNTVCDDNFCAPDYHVVAGLCTPCAVGEHTPGYDDINIGETKCCKADEYEYQPPTPNINNMGGSDRICKPCYGNADANQDVEQRYANLRCCTKGYDYMCSRIYDGYSKACFDETQSQCANFEKYGDLQQGEGCTHTNQCADGGVCNNSFCV